MPRVWPLTGYAQCSDSVPDWCFPHTLAPTISTLLRALTLSLPPSLPSQPLVTLGKHPNRLFSLFTRSDMNEDIVQTDLEYGPSPSSRHSLSLPRVRQGLDLMSDMWTVHSFSDPAGLGGSTIHEGPIASPPQSMYISDSAIEEKFSQGENLLPPLPSLYLPPHPESKTIGLVVSTVQ
jgi:hypothetical protein